MPKPATPIRPLIGRYPGGKRKMAVEIWEAMGCPAAAAFPFAGALGAAMGMGVRPAILAERCTPVRALYEAIRDDPARFWRDVDALPDVVSSAEEFNALRADFNSPLLAASQSAARLMALAVSSFNGLVRFNRAGEFNAAAGRPMPRRVDKRTPEDRERLSGLFANASIFNDWRPAVDAAVAAGLPIYADPPYLGAFDYGSGWKAAHLLALLRALPIGAVISENTAGEAQRLIEGSGFDLVEIWTRKGSGMAQDPAKRVQGEGIWCKVRRDPMAWRTRGGAS